MPDSTAPKSSASTEAAIETTALTKTFGRQRAVDGVDLRVPRGSVFGFLGPNGSGKTSTIRMLLGLTQATSGDIRLLGAPMPGDLRRVLPRVGALVEGPAFAPFLSGRANLHRLDTADRDAPSASRRDRVDAALDRVGLGHAADKKAHAYSLGMKQRLGIAGALLMPRELLILDEPSNGLDPQGTREVRSLIGSLADDGTTVFVSSHLLSEIEQMCSHVAVMSAGRLLTQGTLDEVRRHGVQRIVVTTPDGAEAAAVLAGLGLEAATTPAGVSAELPVDDTEPERITAALVAAGVRVRGLQVTGATLEDRFVDLTGEGFDVAG
ncbi:ABC-2 type transport system ATP-binding protein [Frondihabitans sp. PhB188]|uniref:ABC transporter ATP-binding protein n=1 Tax=Frondihabitans sp. PhB188 TaxID=2485200 RepID=UPI000F470147|nr:ATP-binding cassette domain-containing protein [Frondihabitans sp. PhB188]ROQ38474.1 ABC-2 type transport system ATP-binding protein [Frondihabitans sp. PhB188]